MKAISIPVACLWFLVGLKVCAQEEAGFVPLFNGQDLSGWTNVNGAPSTWTVQDNQIICSGIPTGVLRTIRQYENYVLELEWMHLRKGGNSGLFVHSAPLPARGQPFTKAIEIQILDPARSSENWTGHGDVFAIHGASFVPDRPHPNGWMRCLPSETRVRPAGQWNQYRVECLDGRVTLAVNGKVVSGGSNCIPRKGYICLESEGGLIHFRNIRIKELPSSNPALTEVADTSQGFLSLYNGIDLSGWKADPGHLGHWQPKDWILDYDGRSEAADKNLWSAKEYGDFVLIVDWRLPRKAVPSQMPVVLPNGDYARYEDGTRQTVEALDAGDSGIYLRGSPKSQVNIWCRPIGSGEVYGYREDRNLPEAIRAAVTPKMKADRAPGEWNRFVITLRGDRLTVELNEKIVIERAQLPGVRPRGPIALQHHGDPIQFANIFIQELD